MLVNMIHFLLPVLTFVCADCSLRLDLVPINRSVGLKAKPTKPVTEVLRPVVSKYGLNLPDLVAKIVSCSLSWLHTPPVSPNSGLISV